MVYRRHRNTDTGNNGSLHHRSRGARCGQQPGPGGCEALLAARDTLAGSRTLNWSGSTAIGSWDGVTVDGSPAGYQVEPP